MGAPRAIGHRGVREAAGSWRADPQPCLLDVNVLIALIDPKHSHHLIAHQWLAQHRAAWATCPLTENSVLRIVGHPRYPTGPGSPAKVAPSLVSVRARPGHCFWQDDLSLLDARIVDATRLLTPHQITDTYLLALAVKHGGKLASFDKRLVADAVRGGNAALHVIEG
ncbi:MAG: TA system VapC family ribonuclease toxin [Rhodanobacteraceae bacterium]